MAIFPVDILTSYINDATSSNAISVVLQGAANYYPDDFISPVYTYVTIADVEEIDTLTFASISQAVDWVYNDRAHQIVEQYTDNILTADTFVLGNRINCSVSVNKNYDNILSSIASFAPVATSGSYTDLTSKPSYATVANTGSYNDLSNKPTIPSTTQTTSSLTLALVGAGATGTQISPTKNSLISATVSVSSTSLLLGAASSSVALKKCATNSSTEANWTTITTATSNLSGVAATNGNTQQVVTLVPAGWFVKLVSSGSGTHSESFISGEQTIYG